MSVCVRESVCVCVCESETERRRACEEERGGRGCRPSASPPRSAATRSRTPPYTPTSRESYGLGVRVEGFGLGC